MVFMKRIFISAVVLLATFSCKKNSEADDLAKAQQCLDRVQESNPLGADECMNYVQKYSSQQANILKCAILVTSGG